MRLSELLEYNDIAIQCHDYPDADAIATGFALYEYLRRNGKQPLFFYSGPQKITKANLLIMTVQLDIPIRYIPEQTRVPELLVTVDCIYGEKNVRHFDAENIAVIDHHTYSRPLPPMSEVRSDLGSCSSLMAKLLEDEDFDINEEHNIATALYYGLYMDTNGMSEIGHPADRDLRDFARYDRSIITMLQNSNLSSDEMQIAGSALRNCIFISDLRTAYVRTKACDQNLLGFISDLIIQVDSVDSCVVFCPNAAGYKLSVRSCSPEINSADLARYLTNGVGDGGGHFRKAGGSINTELLGSSNISDLISDRMMSYYTDTDMMYAGKEHIDTSGMQKYVKKDIVFGFVPSVEVVPEGGDIFIRMKEADTTIRSSENIYIMVGVSGEVYPIKKDVFMSRYTVCDEAPETVFRYGPSVIDRTAGRSRPLSGYLRGCRAGESSVINAKELTRYTKIFTEWNKDGYLYGVPGDYIAVRSDDDTDFYIIKRDIFMRSYEKEH